MMLLAMSTTAQDFQKNIFGVRAGLNISSMSLSGDNSDFSLKTKSKAGIHIGFDYQRLLLKSMPLYLETGLFYSNKGFKYDTADIEWAEDDEVQHNLLIPMIVNYKIRLPHNFAIEPAAGLYYSCSVASVGYIDAESDFGLKVGVGATWKSIYLGIGYELGFLNLGYDEVKAKNRNFMISVGYNF